jgi:hypothetical protein
MMKIKMNGKVVTQKKKKNFTKNITKVTCLVLKKILDIRDLNQLQIQTIKNTLIPNQSLINSNFNVKICSNQRKKFMTNMNRVRILISMVIIEGLILDLIFLNLNGLLTIIL